ncbi:unnamed protein product [Cuscuta europaea]|uniref:Uncharacterized protein n=1 Tax=Cuscuta europaea TaxID=41803 RepID=A0A9P0ZYA8_CUSEU|nr:unnamed protein product [Cuscuta europaea]
MASFPIELVDGLNVRLFTWTENILLDRFSKCGLLLFRMKRSVSRRTSAVFEESDVQLFDLVSHSQYLPEMINGAAILTGFFLPQTTPFLAAAVSDCLRGKFNVCEDTLLCLGKSRVVVVIDVETKRLGQEKGYRISTRHARLYEELCEYDEEEEEEEDGESRGVMITVREMDCDEEMSELDSDEDEKSFVLELDSDEDEKSFVSELDSDEDEKSFLLDVFGDHYDEDYENIICSIMTSLSKTPDFLRQGGGLICDEFQEFKEVVGGLKLYD